MTPRRLLVLIRALPDDATFRAALQQAQEREEAEAKVAHIRRRQAYYDKQREAAP